MTSGSSSFSSLDGIGSNIHVVGLDDLTSLYNSSSPIVENEWNCSSGDLQCPPLILAPLINMSKGSCENKSALFILFIFHSKNSQNSNLSLK